MDEPPLEVLPISIWNPTSRGSATPPTMPDEVTRNRDRFEAAGDVSSILRDSDLRRVGALPVEEALALLLQGTVFVRPSAFVDLFLYYFSFVS